MRGANVRSPALYREGETRFAEGDWQEAMLAFEKMLSLDPNDEWGVMARMRESRRQRDLAQRYAQAVQLYEEQRWEEASELFHRLMDEEPNYQDTTLRLREIDKQGRAEFLCMRKPIPIGLPVNGMRPSKCTSAS